MSLKDNIIKGNKDEEWFPFYWKCTSQQLKSFALWIELQGFKDMSYGDYLTLNEEENRFPLTTHECNYLIEYINFMEEQ